MSKKYGLIFRVIILISLLASCATTESKYLEAERMGTTRAYESFLGKYPSGELSEKARRQIATIKENERKKECQKLLDIMSSKGYTNYTCKMDIGDKDVLSEVNCASIQIIGGLESFTKCVDGTIGNLRLSDIKEAEAKNLLKEYLQVSLRSTKIQVKDACKFDVVVVCPESTRALLGGGARWDVPTYASERDLRKSGPRAGHCEMSPLIEGSVFILDNEAKSLIFYKYVYGLGSTMEGILKDFTGNIATQITPVDKLTCENECRELLKKGQLRSGTTIAECIKELCK